MDAINQCLKKLEESLKKMNIEVAESFVRMDNALRKESFDSASKISSGYGDEESTEDETEREHYFDEAKVCVDNVVVTSDDEAFFDEGPCNSCFLNKQIKFLKIINPLALYPPSKETKIAKDLNFSMKSLQENHGELIKTFLTDSKLNMDNIHFVYKMLLEMEDVTCMSEYLPLAQKDVILNCTGMSREYWISLKDCPNMDDTVTPLIDEVVLVPKESSAISAVVPLKYMTDFLLPHEHESEICDAVYRRRIATVQRITQDRAYFRFSKMEHLLPEQVASLMTTKYDIIFRSPRYPLRYQHYALELLADSHALREYLFPKENPYKELFFQPKMKLNLFNTTISSNPEQLEAVHYLVEGRNVNAPFVIFGPPGTGKTTTIVESILQLRLQHPRSRILVTAGSNSACDTIALRICKYFKSSPRLRNQRSIIRIYSRSVIEKGVHSIDSELLVYANCWNGLHYYPSIEEVRNYGIIVATLCTVGKYVTCDIGKMQFFTHIFMDEAGASTVPEALVGIMGIKSDSDCRLILSGDHKQLGPILKSERAAQLGLKYSLMEHLLSFNCYAVDDNCNYDHTLQARLRRNYRSHPEIVRLYNHLYYNGELIAEANKEDVNMAAKWCKLPNPKFPIIFQAAHGVAGKNKMSPSSFNNLEVEVVMWFLRRLLVDGINGEKVNQTDIGIITPYKLQTIHIQNSLNTHGWRYVDIGSVEKFQGREKQIIIVSLVRSFSGLGFVGDPKRLNVLLSRPQSLLILIGNPLTLRHHPDFAYIMDECKKHGTFLRKKKTRKLKTNNNNNNISSLI